jgi:deoxyribonuclease-4
MQIGLKLGTKNIQYTEDINSFYEQGYFHYIELFAVPGTFDVTINYWQQFSIPVVIHAPHSAAGMNLALREEHKNNEKKLQETFQFANTLNAEYIIFHAGVNGAIDETIGQLSSFVDARCLIENKPLKGLNNEKCIGATSDEVSCIMNELKIGFCLDFGHAICTANSLKEDSLSFINNFLQLKPTMYHLTDGDYISEYDSHLHYGQGTFPIKKLLGLVPENKKLTNEAKHNSDANLNDFRDDIFYVRNL